MVKKDPFTHEDLFPKISFGKKFKTAFKRFKDEKFRTIIKKRVKEIICDHAKGKPMRNVRKGTLEVKIGSYRLSYMYIEETNEIVFLDLYHKDYQ